MKIQLELNGPEPIVVNASIPPITFTTAGFHVDWEPLASLREVEPRRKTILPQRFKASFHGRRFL